MLILGAVRRPLGNVKTRIGQALTSRYGVAVIAEDNPDCIPTVTLIRDMVAKGAASSGTQCEFPIAGTCGNPRACQSGPGLVPSALSQTGAMSGNARSRQANPAKRHADLSQTCPGIMASLSGPRQNPTFEGCSAGLA